METSKHITAGPLACAGAARLRVAPGAATLAGAPAAYPTPASHGHHVSTSWIVGAIAKPGTFMVFDRKNRPTRHLSELSP